MQNEKEIVIFYTSDFQKAYRELPVKIQDIVDKKEAIIETSEDKVWSVNVSGTLGTTADSPTATDGAIGGWIDTDSSGSNYARVLESTFTRTQTGDENFFVWGIDPDDTTRYLVSIANSLKKAGTH